MIVFLEHELMVSKSIIRKHFQTIPKTSANILEFCKNTYEDLARLRGDLFVPNYLEQLVRQVCHALGMSNSVRNKIVRELFHITLSYRVRSGIQTNQAPIFHPSKHLTLIKFLWHRKIPSVQGTFAHRTAAVHALICFYSFRRWVDATRIRWEHCSRTVVQNRVFLKFTLAASKTNTKGKRNEFITLQQNDCEFCPIKILRQYWHMQGCPRTGFVLPCINRNRTYVSNSLYREWDAYACKGHSKSAAGKVPCLGEIDGRQSFGIYQRGAKFLKWETSPHKHSFRRAGIVISNKLNIPRERVTEFFGWRHDSTMPSLYVGSELATTSQGIAWKFSDAIADNFKCLNDISFTD